MVIEILFQSHWMTWDVCYHDGNVTPFSRIGGVWLARPFDCLMSAMTLRDKRGAYHVHH